jgi:PAS domain S-box-containing protein
VGAAGVIVDSAVIVDQRADRAPSARKKRMSVDEAWHQTDRLHASTGKGDPFAAAIRATRMPMIISDPRQPDNPIVFANDAFLDLTGYAREELLGRNCRFLQGPLTDRAAVAAVRDAVANLESIAIDLLNYRKDGSTFWNALYVSPVIDEKGELRFFFASQLDVSERKEAQGKIQAARDHFEQMSAERSRAFNAAYADLQASNAKLKQALETQTALLHEVDHRVKNNLQMVSSLVLLQSRSIPDEAIRRSLLDILSRIEALGTVHRRLYQSDDVSQFDVADFVRDLVTDLVGVASRDRITVDFALSTALVRAEHAAPIALIVNEVATNSLKHAFPDHRSGILHAEVCPMDGRLRIVIADDGIGKDVTGLSSSSFGTSLIRTLARQLKAKVTWSNNEPGTRVTIDLPL